MQLEETQKRSSKLIELFERIFLSDRFLRHFEVLCFGAAVLFWVPVIKATDPTRGGLGALLEPKSIGLILAAIPTAAIPMIFHAWKEYKDENKDVRLKAILKVSIFILLTASISVFLILYK